MRVLMTTDTVGGVWTFTKELAGELLREGCAVALVSLGRMPSAAQQMWADVQQTEWGEQFLFKPLDTPLEWMAGNERAFCEAEPVLVRIVEDFGAELLLSSQYCFGAAECGIPRVVVAHSDVLSWAEVCRPQGRLEPSAWLDRYSGLVAKGLDAADVVVAPTRWMLTALGTNFALPDEHWVISNGRTLPAINCEVDRKLQCVTAGRLWDEAKNLQLLLEVDSPIPLLVAGETEYESTQLSMSNDVKWLGALDEAEMIRVFRESAIYICTSRYEPFGLAPLEAAQCGCAVLANDIPSLHEVWGDAALYFSGPESLSEWLWRLSDHPGLLSEAQRSSTRRARELTAERMGAGYLELFRSMLKQSLVGRHVA